MYSLIKKLEWPDLLTRQVPSLLSALVLAELFYKFHSFVLECVAFLATWFVIEAAISLLLPGRARTADRDRP